MFRHSVLFRRLGFLFLLAATVMITAHIAQAANGDNPLSPAASFAGSFSDGKLTLKLSESGADYVGTITLGENQFPAKANTNGQGLTGTFQAAGKPFTFTAKFDGDRLIFVTGTTTYTLAKAPVAAANPLDSNSGPAPVANPLAPATPAATPTASGQSSAAPSSSADFSVLGATQTGKTLFAKLPAATTLESAITQTADDLGKMFDAKPALTGAFADSQTKCRGGALFTAKLSGHDIHGWIFCSAPKPGGGGGATATVIYAPADAPRSDVSTLFAFMPAQMKMQTHQFPDGSGSVDLPPGWTTQQTSLSFGAVIKGPAGQTVGMGNSIIVNTPDGQIVRTAQQTYQIQMQTYKMQMAGYQQNVQARRQYPNILALTEPKKPTPPDPARDMPNLIFCRYCAGPEEVLKYFYPAMEAKGKGTGGPYTSLDKVIEVVPADPNPLIPGSKAGVAYIAVSDHNGDAVTHVRVINRINTYPILDGKDSWVVVFNVMRAPDATFDRDLPVMNDIMSSFKMNMDVVNKQIEQNGARCQMGEDSERQLLKQAHDFNQQQAENFNRFETQELAREQARHDSNSDFIEYITGVRDVYDTRTGQTTSVDLFNVNGIVQGMNDAALDPNRFVQIPLRYER